MRYLLTWYPWFIHPQTIKSLSKEAHSVVFGEDGQAWKTHTNIVTQDYYDERLTVEAIIENVNRT